MIRNRKIGNRKKLVNRKKSENRKKLEKRENRNISISGPNHGANERPKGEPVAVGDLKASFEKGNPKFSKMLVFVAV